MNSTIQAIPLESLALAFLPVVIVLFILHRWDDDYKETLYGLARMLVQLLAVGYVLVYIFNAESALLISGILMVMLLVSSWIALRTAKTQRKALYPLAFISIALGGGSVLVLITQAVLKLDVWYMPHVIIPIAGMIFAASMNSVSIATERMATELTREENYKDARSIALKAALIPITNALFAVGIVSLPGMMTGQILTGTSPLIAARYQIMVMCMMYAAAGLSASLFLILLKQKTALFTKKATQE